MSGWQGAQELHAEGGHAVAYKGMVDCFVRTVREEGTKALFKVEFSHLPQGQLASLRYLLDWNVNCRCMSLMMPSRKFVWHSMLQGLLPNYIKVVPSIAIAFVTYEKLKEGLGVELRISS